LLLRKLELVQLYEVRPRHDKRGVDPISDVLPFGGLWYTKPDDAVGYAKFYSRSHKAVIRVYDAAGNVIETHTGDFKKLQFASPSLCASVSW
jgi:hypothetical protein